MFVTEQDMMSKFPPTRYMGSKETLIPFIRDTVQDIEFTTVLDAFSGSGVVSYLFKIMGKQVHSNDFLKFAYNITKATVENNHITLDDDDIDQLLQRVDHPNFIETQFKGLYFHDDENRFLDNTLATIRQLDDEYKRALARSALARACYKKRPRGIFTYTGLKKYDDGRKDLTTSLEQHFLNAIDLFNDAIFNNGHHNRAFNSDIFDFDTGSYDLVYMDPPYYSSRSDNDYSRRYHFLEGMMTYWDHVEINHDTKTKKFDNFYTPFDKKRAVNDAFDQLFDQFSDSILVLSYSSNSEPTKEVLKQMMLSYKDNVDIVQNKHTYSFGTQKSKNKNNQVFEYLFVGY